MRHKQHNESTHAHNSEDVVIEASEITRVP